MNMHFKASRVIAFAITLAVVFAIYIYVYGFGIPAIAFCVVAALLLAAASIDLDTYTIPNVFVVGISLVFFAMLAAETMAGVPMTGVVAQAIDGLLGSLVVGGGMLLFSIVFDLVTGRMSLGGGDIKLLLAVNLFLGLRLSILNLVLCCVFGLLFALVSNVHKPESEGADFKQRVIPFGPSIALASIISQLGGPFLLGQLGGLL